MDVYCDCASKFDYMKQTRGQGPNVCFNFKVQLILGVICCISGKVKFLVFYIIKVVNTFNIVLADATCAIRCVDDV